MTEVAALKKRRRPFVWQPPQVPVMTDFFAGAEGRRRWLAYWRSEGRLDLRDAVFFALMRGLPADFTLWFGSWHFRFTMRKAAAVHRRVRENLTIIRPDLDEAAREKLAWSYFDNVGRTLAEFALLRRLGRAGRMHDENGATIKTLQSQGPVILLGLHLANWEAMLPVFAQLGVAPAFIFKPPERAAQLRIALKVRKSLGANLLPPGIAGARPALRVLQGGGLLCMFGDEEHEGRAMAPFFGKPHLDGNLTIVARLARKTSAKVVVFHGERRPAGHYTITFGDPIALPSQKEPQAPLEQDVMALNAAIEPIVRAHCGTWYFLAHARPIASVTAPLR